MFSPTLANPSAGGLPGATIYEGEGPALQLPIRQDRSIVDSGRASGRRIKSTRRWCFAADGESPTRRPSRGNPTAVGTLGAGGWNTFNFQSPGIRRTGQHPAPGLIYDRDALFVGQERRGHQAFARPGRHAAAWIHPDAGKMPKLNAVEHLAAARDYADLVVDVAYVGNRGTGFTANNLVNLNAISDDRLQSFGLDLQQRRRPGAAARAPGFGARGIARLQQAAVCQLLRREYRGAEPAAVPAVRQRSTGARRAARRVRGTTRCR